MKKSTMLIETDHGVRVVDDTKEFPTIDLGKLEEVFDIPALDEQYREEEWGTYSFHGIPVPRVSFILKDCIGKEGLTAWAAKVGTKKMNQIREDALTIGTYVHELIDRVLMGERYQDLNFSHCGRYTPAVRRCVKNFELWKDELQSKGYIIEEVYGIEEPIITPYYGGTIDAIVRINGAVYIIDFKTSKSINYEYILQTCAYMWGINAGYHESIPYVDGIGIIRVDKYSERYEDLFLNLSIEPQKVMIDYYIKTFGDLLMSYYMLKNATILFDSYRIAYDRYETIYNGGSTQ